MTSTIGKGKSPAGYFDLPGIDAGGYDKFISLLSSTELDLTSFKEDMSFSGFNKEKIAKLAAERLGARRTLKLVFLAAYRGTNLSKILAKSVKPDEDVVTAHKDKLILSNGKGPEDLTMGRLLACFPQFAAYFLLKYKCPKKVLNSQCPAAIQFPAAASLPMSPPIRLLHVSFCHTFSLLIGSKFDMRYYQAAFNGQEEPKDLDSGLLALLGNPTSAESRAVDLDQLYQSISGGVKV